MSNLDCCPVNLGGIWEFVRMCHFPQKYGKHSYMYHVERVLEVANTYSRWYQEFRKPAFQIACLGHDLVEDTHCTPDDMREYGFPEQAIELILCVTDEPGKNRKERKLRTYPKIRTNPLAVALKLCDRIANVLHSVETESDLIEMYRAEQTEFSAQLRRQGEWDKLWTYLDWLCE